MSLLHRSIKLPFNRDHFVAWFTGSEAGLATTTAIIAGLMVTHTSINTVVTAAIISFLVQAFNSAIIHYSNERMGDEIDREDIKNGYFHPAVLGVWFWLWHTLMSVMVLLPILFVPDQFKATVYSIVITLVLMFAVGAVKGKIVKRDAVQDGLEMVIVGGLVICAGLVAGIILS